MNAFRFLLFLLFTHNICFAQYTNEELLTQLDGVIEKREVYSQKKLSVIDSLEKVLSQPGLKAEDRYMHYLHLSEEYQVFKFDSAFYYTEKLLRAAYQTGQPEKIARAKIEFGNILISSGMFKESLDTLFSVDLKKLGDELKARYYTVFGRVYSDMESYSQSEYYSEIYHRKGLACFDSAMNYLPVNSRQFISVNAQKNSKLGRKELAKELFEEIIHNYPLMNDQLAVEASGLSFVYKALNQPDKALEYMIKASIADFKGAKKEAVALMHVANALYEKGDIERASRYINVALEESNFYGSNLRLAQIAQYLPVIKSKHIQTVEKQKRKLLWFVVVVSLLSAIILGFVFVIIKQISRLKKAKMQVEEAKAELEKINDQLSESNRIKEEYLGYYFTVNSQMIEKMDALKKSIDRKFKQKRFDDISFDLKNLNIKKEKENLFVNFDRVFLKIFPNFIDKFNLLLNKEDRIILKEDQLLNTDLRIFALIPAGHS